MILVDAEDEAILNSRKWRIISGYVVSDKTKNDTNITTYRIYLHREIMHCPEGKYVDHINGNKLDNRKANLRICTIAENSRNVGLRKDNKTGHKGVFYSSGHKAYKATIRVNKKQIYLGCFKDINKAIAAYQAAAVKYHGEFARF